MGTYRKTDDAKVTRHTPKHQWAVLPANGRKGAPPKLPAWRSWSADTRKAWAVLWSKPQAVMWDQDGSSLFRWALLHELMIDEDVKNPAVLSAEMRQLEDRHGLSPKAMAQLAWKIGADDEAEVEPDATPAPVRRLRVVDTG